uniref:Uncharacterized protein n=1 Tax=Podoviridae sp. ct8Lf7 TaxID=2827723 RepID=A0A8S5S096_9CAUD|nr:MAG TPA: hypothetical protein [Podoviridae sp. ct8Lf7]
MIFPVTFWVPSKGCPHSVLEVVSLSADNALVAESALPTNPPAAYSLNVEGLNHNLS